MSGIAVICLFVSLAAPGLLAPEADAPGLDGKHEAILREALGRMIAGMR